MSKVMSEDEELAELLKEKEQAKNKPKVEVKKEVMSQAKLDANNYNCFSYFKNEEGRYEIIELEYNPYNKTARIKEYFKDLGSEHMAKALSDQGNIRIKTKTTMSAFYRQLKGEKV